jgi:hypothetical protein
VRSLRSRIWDQPGLRVEYFALLRAFASLRESGFMQRRPTKDHKGSQLESWRDRFNCDFTSINSRRRFHFA